MRKVLITGAGGFLGRHCLPHLAARADEVHAVVRPDSPPMALEASCQFHTVHVHRANLLDPSAVEGLATKVQASHLLHLAWVATSGEYWTSPENQAWVDASLRLLRAFAEHGGRRAVLAGTCAEYDWAAGRCREDWTPLKPASLYGECKNALRERAEAYARRAGLGVAWARLFFLYGPREAPRRLVPTVARALLRGEPALCSSGVQRRDFLHVEDAATALVDLLRSDLAGPVNIGSGKAVPVHAVVRRLAALVGRPDLLRLDALPATNEAALVVADVSRLREDVGWAPRFALDFGLAQTVEWWKAQCTRLAA
jgi:nucleoside-diphosphate-sugar epimerase